MFLFGDCLLLLFLLFSSLISLYDAVNYVPHIPAQDWCAYIHNTSEPKLIVYNRLPKCGSSTIQHILRESHRQVKHLQYFALNSSYWGLNYDADEAARNKLYDVIREKVDSISVNDTLLLDGHFNFHSLPEFNNRDVGYFQLTRECRARAKSSVMYSLLGSSSAREAKENNSTDEFLSRVLNTTITNGEIEECLNSLECLQNSELWQEGYPFSVTGKLMSGFFCGDNCVAKYNGSMLIGALRHMMDPVLGYSVVGIMEHMEESVEMFECVFPSAFHGAAKRYHTLHTHDRQSFHGKTTAAMEALFDHACNSTDSHLYDRSRSAFLERLSYMRSHRSSCCRSMPRFS